MGQKITDSVVGMEHGVVENGIAEGNNILDISTNTIQPMVNKLLNIEDESKSEMPKSEETNNSEHKEVTELINTELAKNTNIKVEIENNIIENSEENMVNGENTKIKVEEFKEEEFLEEEFKEEDFKEEETELVETKTEETEINQSKGDGSIPELDKTPKDEMSKADDLEVENKDNVEKVSEGVMKVVDTVIEETLLEGTKLDTEDMNVAKKESDVTKVEKNNIRGNQSRNRTSKRT